MTKKKLKPKETLEAGAEEIIRQQEESQKHSLAWRYINGDDSVGQEEAYASICDMEAELAAARGQLYGKPSRSGTIK